MSPPVRLEPCRSARDWRLFERVPELLHGADPCFVPPFPGQVAKLRKPGHPFHLDGSLTPYVAFSGRRPVGRIAAIVNRTHNRVHGDRTGFFGFFDFTDEGVAGALLDRARVDLAAAGLTRPRGPFGPTQNDECGLQVDGFGEAPYFGMPYNPSYYVEVYERLGLERVSDMLAYGMEPARADEFLRRLNPLAERLRRRQSITIRPADPGRLEEECALVARVFNEALAGEWNFMPLSTETALSFVKDLLSLLEPEAILIAEVAGEPIGLSIALPNLNEFLADAARLPRWLRWPRLAWLIKTRRCQRARWAVFAVVPAYRGYGTTGLLVQDAFSRLMPKYPVGELSWTQEHNEEINKLVSGFDVHPTKRYCIYETAT